MAGAHLFLNEDQSIDVKMEIIPISVEPNLGRHWLNTLHVSPFLVFRLSYGTGTITSAVLQEGEIPTPV